MQQFLQSTHPLLNMNNTSKSYFFTVEWQTSKKPSLSQVVNSVIINDHVLNTFCLLRSWSLSWHLRPCSGILPTEELESTLLWLLVKRNKTTCFLSFDLCSPTITIACYWSTITEWFFLHWHLNVNSGLAWNLKDCHVLREDDSEVCAATVCTSSPSLWDFQSVQVLNTALCEVKCLLPQHPLRSNICAVVLPKELSCQPTLFEKLSVGSEGIGSTCWTSLLPTAVGDFGPCIII